MRLLVTGGAGFIGRHVVDAATAAGHDVTRLDLVDGDDVRDPDVAERAVHRVDVVAHLAAKVGRGVDVADLPAYASHNDVGTTTLLAAMARRGVRRLVLASSMVVYGEGRGRCPQHGVTRGRPREPGAQPLLDRGQLGRHVHQQRADQQPGRREVDGDEVPGPRVVLQDVEEARDQLEQRCGDEQPDRRTLGAVHERTHRWPLAQPVLHGPQLGQQQRDRRDAGDHVDALGEAVSPRRRGRRRQPPPRMRVVLADQPGREADEHGHADGEPEASGERPATRRSRVGRRPPRGWGIGQAGERRRHGSIVLPTAPIRPLRSAEHVGIRSISLVLPATMGA
ncbi:NAD-dependent epimerase/dehydratase family protein [Luteipulveratus halotolerans]|uniref:NAD-dependent epimerase/dehydratase family protein n=1 Tax=Luteipulveratus halotolerans TaxID=1631356 RepID=UPI0008FC0E9D|nr:NAD(P)-dependent oxidoreductase [Luteipulveratus halotolerans]